MWNRTRLWVPLERDSSIFVFPYWTETLAFGHACCMSKSIFSNMKCNLKSLEVDVVISALEKNLLEAEVHLGFRTVLSMCTQTRRVYSWTLETCLLSISRGFSEHFLQVCLLLCSVGSWRLVWCVCVEGRGLLSGAVFLLTLCVPGSSSGTSLMASVFNHFAAHPLAHRFSL